MGPKMEQRQLFLPPDTTGISEPDILTMIVTGLDELLGIEIGLQKKRRAAVAGIFLMRGTFSGREAPRARDSAPCSAISRAASPSPCPSLSSLSPYYTRLPTIPDRSLILSVIRTWSAILGLVLSRVRRSNALVSLANEDDPM